MKVSKGRIQKNPKAEPSTDLPSDIETENTGELTTASSMPNDLIVEIVEISTLKFSKRHLRKGFEERVAKHVVFQQEYGHLVHPVVADDGSVLFFEEALVAARQSGQTHYAVVRKAGLTSALRRKLRLFEAKIEDTGELDRANVQFEFLEILKLEPDFSFEALGFGATEIDLTFEYGDGASSDELDPADQVELELQEKAVTRSGDIWEGSGHKVMCGDACKKKTYRKLLNGKKAKATAADAPYGVPIRGHVSGLGKTKHREFVMGSKGVSTKDLKKLLKKSIRNFRDNSKPGALFYLFMDFRGSELIQKVCRKLGLTLINICVWKKTSPAMGSFYRSQHEFVIVVRNGSAQHQNNVELGRHGRSRSNVWEFPGVNSFGKGRMEQLSSHPTPKPVRMIEELIKDCTSRGDIVLDGFLGSGTTLIAAQNTGRKAYCVELDPLYVDVAIRRYQKRFGVEMIHQATGLTFNEVEQQRLAEPARRTALRQDKADVTSSHRGGRVRSRKRPAPPVVTEGA